MSETDDGSDETSQVHAYVNCAQKQRWEDHIEDSYEVDSMSEFVRTAAERYIRHEEHESPSTVPSDSQGAQGTAIEDHISQVLDAVGGLSGQLQDVQQRLSVVESELTHPPELTDLSSQVLHVLPRSKPQSDDWDMAKVNHTGDSSIVWSGTVEGIINHFGGYEHMDYPEERVTDALNQLQADTSVVRSEVVGDELRYWRTD